jgi:hypothetical protein
MGAGTFEWAPTITRRRPLRCARGGACRSARPSHLVAWSLRRRRRSRSTMGGRELAGARRGVRPRDHRRLQRALSAGRPPWRVYRLTPQRATAIAPLDPGGVASTANAATPSSPGSRWGVGTDPSVGLHGGERGARAAGVRQRGGHHDVEARVEGYGRQSVPALGWAWSRGQRHPTRVLVPVTGRS